MKIWIDGGHGEDTAGKGSPDKELREWAWNREVASMIVSQLNEWGFDAQMLVPEKWDVSLSERCARVNASCDELGKENVVLVSVHINAAGNGKEWKDAQGWSVWTSRGQSDSDVLAEYMYEAAGYYFPERKRRFDTSDGDHDWESNFTILAKTKCPAVLVENFFMDNRDDKEFLLTNDAKRRCADTILDGLILYIQRL